MSDDESSQWKDTLLGTGLGALAGGGMGLGACMFIFDDPPLFVGDTILFGALICGVLGFLYGESFIDWLKENVIWFWT